MATKILVLGILGVAAYFLGNISPSTIMAQKQGMDIKKEGSGNAGTTNALRIMGKKAGAITCAVDILKGFVAVLIGVLLAGGSGAAVCGLCVFLGHIWPILYKLKGGKGVATAFGGALAVNPLVAVIALAIVVIFVFTTKRMSVGSIFGAACFPIICAFLEPGYFITALVIAIIIIIKHRANIVRLIHGEEPIMGIFEKKTEEDK
ncbi:MAG: glycerol-3-phosphate 1-O-acyltransferase PlsY [Bacillota bacterium]|nr:glycerol-3-phosphate 1-O-acyltransferase PlsY [Bacillota bacterium]